MYYNKNDNKSFTATFFWTVWIKNVIPELLLLGVLWDFGGGAHCILKN